MALHGHQRRPNLPSLPDALLFAHCDLCSQWGSVSVHILYLCDTVLLSTAHGRLSTVVDIMHDACATPISLAKADVLHQHTTSNIILYYLNRILAGPFDRKGEEAEGYT